MGAPRAQLIRVTAGVSAAAARLVELDERGEDVAVAGMNRERGPQAFDRGVYLAGGVQRDCVDVSEPRVSGLQPSRARELAQRGVAAVETGQHEAEREMEHAAVWCSRQAIAQETLTLRITTHRAVHVGEIHVRGYRRRFHADRRSELCL